ncbi:uncharacterized protein [Battus philenor]|uniref:uncharacterized protein n=1 Tax=Battus philenor TaxID=42288 RepID=UPI0035CF9767
MFKEIKIVETCSKLYSNSKVQALETTLLQSCANFKDVICEYEGLIAELECSKNEISIQKEKCEKKLCEGSEALKKVIAVKDTVIQSVANILIEMHETKNLKAISEAFRVIFGENSPLSPPSSEFNKVGIEYKIKDEMTSNVQDGYESSSDIEDTQADRKSPIIQSKKLKNNTSSTSETIQLQEKKKCPETWHTPEKKVLKLTFSSAKGKPGMKFRQARLKFVKAKTSNVIDLTSSPGTLEHQLCDSNIENIKKEVMDSEDTILPSPTSGPVNYTSVFKSITKDSPKKTRKILSIPKTKAPDVSDNDKENKSFEDMDATDMEVMNVLKDSNRGMHSPDKWKKPLSLSKLKTEHTIVDDQKNTSNDKERHKEVEESMALLKNFPNGFPTSPKQDRTPSKPHQVANDDANESMSLLQNMKFDDKHTLCPNSPGKRSTHEGVQATDIVLKPNLSLNRMDGDNNVKRTKSDLKQPVFKEPTVRKKSEKQALPGWSCEECKQFYEELYKDDPKMLREKIEACSRHRGRSDPVRPRTPPGFWQPRWHVPSDTDEFNRLNDAL